MTSERLRAMLNAQSAPAPMMWPWPDPTNERIKKLEAENKRLRAELATAKADALRKAADHAWTMPGDNSRVAAEWIRARADELDLQ